MNRRNGTVLLVALAVTATALTGCKRRPRAPVEQAATPALGTGASGEAAPDAAAPGEDAASGPTPEWSETSLSRTYVLRQFRTGPQTCRLESVRQADSQTRWVNEVCVATKDQLVFVADDGDRFLVLEVLAAPEEGSKLRAELGRAYLMGAVAGSIKAGKMIGSPDKLREVGDRFLWLAGIRDEKGTPPALVPGGVRLSTLDGFTRTLQFDGTQVVGSPDAGASDSRAWLGSLKEDGGRPSPGQQAEREAERAEAEWRGRFGEARGKVASAEKEVEAAKARIDSIERDGLPGAAPAVRTYRQGTTQEQIEQAQAIEWLNYKRQIAEQLQAARTKLADAEARLRLAREAFEELERKARFEAVPLEWRK
ncbi:MAG TPA: hypothetical protein VGK67_17255 [Myxococcales bacterium]|jgi:hypothetical protein